MNIDIIISNRIKIIPKFRGYYKREKKGSSISFWNDCYWINGQLHFLFVILELNNGK